MLNTPRSAVQLIKQGIPRIPPPSTPPPSPPPLHTMTPSPPHPPPLPPFNMANTMNMLVFKGIGRENPKQLWFVVGVVWTTHHIMDDNINKAS